MEPSSVPCPPRRLHDGPTPEFSEPTPPPSTIRGAGTLGEPGQHRAGMPRPQLVGLPEVLSERGRQHWGQVPQGFTPAPPAGVGSWAAGGTDGSNRAPLLGSCPRLLRWTPSAPVTLQDLRFSAELGDQDEGRTLTTG